MQSNDERIMSGKDGKPAGVLVRSEDLGRHERPDATEQAAVIRPLADSVRAFRDPFEAAAEWEGANETHEQSAHLSERAAGLEEVAAEEVVEA
jgi:hypothetical protein